MKTALSSRTELVQAKFKKINQTTNSKSITIHENKNSPLRIRHTIKRNKTSSRRMVRTRGFEPLPSKSKTINLFTYYGTNYTSDALPLSYVRGCGGCWRDPTRTSQSRHQDNISTNFDISMTMDACGHTAPPIIISLYCFKKSKSDSQVTDAAPSRYPYACLVLLSAHGRIRTRMVCCGSETLYTR